VSSKPRADKAREYLECCRHGHQKMSSNPTGPGWVLVWAGTIALLLGGRPRTQNGGCQEGYPPEESAERLVEHAESHEAKFPYFLEIHRL
jgi:hypothetical protein